MCQQLENGAFDFCRRSVIQYRAHTDPLQWLQTLRLVFDREIPLSEGQLVVYFGQSF